MGIRLGLTNRTTTRMQPYSGVVRIPETLPAQCCNIRATPGLTWSNMDPLVGSDLGPYYVEHRVGGGGMGVVYGAIHRPLQQRRALKVLRPHLAEEDARLVHRFVREARTAARLRHPNIVQIYDVGEDRGLHYMAMEFLEGTSLRDLIRRAGPLSLSSALPLLSQLADAIDFGHGHGVVHRDIKPENILIGQIGRVTLLDFGIARAADGTRLTSSGMIIGTPAYMAPEVVQGADADPNADLYAFGVVAYELLTGRPPFDDPQLPQLLFAQVHRPPPDPRHTGKDLPDSAARALVRQLSKNPAQRHPSARAFVEALRDDAALNPARSTAAVAGTSHPRPSLHGAHTRRVYETAQSGKPPSTVRRGWIAVSAVACALLAIVSVAALVMTGALAPGSPQAADAPPVATPLAIAVPSFTPTGISASEKPWVANPAIEPTRAEQAVTRPAPQASTTLQTAQPPVTLAAPTPVTELRRPPLLPPASPAGGQAPSPPAVGEDPRVEAALAQLQTDEAKVGQLFLLGWIGSTAEAARPVIRDLRPGGIVYVQNAKTSAEAKAVNAALPRIAAEHGVLPPLLAIDHEGGNVQRIEDITNLGSNWAYGQARPSDLAACQRGQHHAQQLRDMGFTMNLAPVLDVNNNPSNPVIGRRSYGDDPELVARLGSAYIRGLQGGGIVDVGKHFPGHGNTGVDSHLELPTLSQGIEQLERIELVPFRRAIEPATDLAAIMSAHIVFPAVDPSRAPATLSREVMTGLLRERLGFRGLSLSDDLGAMKAITDNYTPGDAATRAVRAGVDMLIVSAELPRQRQYRDGLLAALRSGDLARARLDNAVRNVLRVKARFGLLDGTAPVEGRCS